MNMLSPSMIHQPSLSAIVVAACRCARRIAARRNAAQRNAAQRIAARAC